ncbi:hypothetical protein IGI04_041414, partial [Brassica rapa subsp. trilocularis]
HECKCDDGDTAKFWFDHWLPTGPLFSFVGQDGPLMMGIPMSSNVAEACTATGWRLPSHRVRHRRVAEVRDHLTAHPLPTQSQGPDVFSWEIPGIVSSDFSSALVNWLQAARGNRLFTIKHIAAQATIYLIWRERNSRMHAGNPQPHSVVFKQLDRCVRDIALARKDRKRFKTMLSIWFRFD